MEEVKNIIESFSPLLESYELKRKEITNRLNEVKDACKQALKEKIQSILTNKTNCFKTEFGAICVKDIVEIRTYDECLSPVVIFDGFYIRGTKDENNNVLYEYGYHDNFSGFLISELEPISKDEFLKITQEFGLSLLKSIPLTERPNHMHREEKGWFSMFYEGAQYVGMDVDYYPDLVCSWK